MLTAYLKTILYHICICKYLYLGVTRLETHKALNFNEDRLHLQMYKIKTIV